jgi:hypothetical protein
MKQPFFGTVAAMSALFACHLATAATNVFDFESTPSGMTPVDNTPLTDPYPVAGGGSVRFFFDASGNNKFDAGIDHYPAFEQIGANPPDGFENTNLGLFDVAAPGFESQLGNFFLIDSVNPGANPPPFIAAYSGTAPITGLSGEIWDIDGASGRGTEQWVVDVLNSNSQVIATLTSPDGTTHGVNSLDGKPWVFNFTNLPADPQAVRLTFIGTSTSGTGFGLNNFAVAVVPEPASALLGGIGAAGLLGLVIQRRSRPICSVSRLKSRAISDMLSANTIKGV